MYSINYKAKEMASIFMFNAFGNFVYFSQINSNK